MADSLQMKKATRALHSIRSRLPDASLLAIASTNLGLNILLTVFNFYYVKVFLEHHHISKEWLYYAQITFLIGSFLIGPCIAYMQDYGCVIWRSRRRMILFVGPLYAIVFMLPWIPWYEIKDKNDATNWAPGIHLTVVMLMWSTCYFIVNACNCGLFAEMSTDPAQRVKALTLNQVAGCVASSAVFPVDALSKSFRDYTMFQVCTGCVAVVAGVCFIFTGFKASDKVAQAGAEEDEEDEEKEKLHVDADDNCKKVVATVESLQLPPQSCLGRNCKNLQAYMRTVCQIVQNKNFCCIVLANFLHFFRVVVSQNFLAVYTEGLISETLLPTGSIMVAAFYLTAQLTPRLIFITCCPLIRIWGAKKTIMGSFVLTWFNAGLGIFLGVFVGYDALAGTLLFECILVVFQDAYVMLYSEVIDDDTRRHKRKFPVSTVLFTMTTLFLQPSTALAPMIVVKALNIGNYDLYKDNMRHAPAYTKHIMFMVATCVPAVAALVAFVGLYFYKHPEQEKRRSSVEKEVRVQ